MRSYLVLTPPGGSAEDRYPDHRSTIVMPDGFSWTALLFPWIWLLWNRLWLAGAAAFLVQVLSGLLISMREFELAGGLLAFSVSLLVALEGRHYRSEALIRCGWTLEDVISAPNLENAEEIYFSGLPEPKKQTMPVSAEWAKQAKAPAAGWQGAQMGLFEHGGR